MSIFFYIFFAFLGYIVGRTGHKYFNVWLKDPIWIPHHWIFGLIIVLIAIWYDIFWILFFGIGLFISDLNDFFEFQFFSKDGLGSKKFWHID